MSSETPPSTPTPSPGPHPASSTDEALLADCRMERTRGSGPGGQRRNKVETAVVLTHVPTGVVARAADDRSPERNRKAALHRLRLALAVEVRTIRAARSAVWTERTRGGRIAVNPKHRDVPALLAEALDVLAACDWEGGEAAADLGTSTSQLVKLLALHPPALEVWNREREARGLRRLRP